MKKYIVFALCIITSLSGMEERTSLITETSCKPRPLLEAQDYSDRGILHLASFLHFMDTSSIDIKNKNILSVACSAGELEKALAQDAASVHGIDNNSRVIAIAQNVYAHSCNKLSFDRCHLEEFKSQKPYQVAIIPFGIHFLKNQKQILQSIHNNLELHGELFGIMHTRDNPKPKNLITFLDIIHNFVELTVLDRANLASTYNDISEQELRTLLCQTGFEIITCEEQSFPFKMKNRQAVQKFNFPILTKDSVETIDIPKKYTDSFLHEFINRMIEKLDKNEDGSFTDTLYTTVIHARKIQK